MALTGTLQCDIDVIMDDKFSYKRIHQLRKGVTPIIFNMCACRDGILLSNSDIVFAKTLEWKQTGLLKKPRLLRRYTPGNYKKRISVSLRAPDLILRMHRKENSPRMSLRRNAATVAISILPQQKPSISLEAIRRIARQSQPSLWDFFNRPFRGNDSVAQELIPIGARKYYECQIF